MLEGPGCEVVIEPDSLFAMQTSQGLWQAGDLQPLASSNFDLLAVAQQRGRISFVHVRGHDLHPWNELADGIARRAAGGSVLPPPAGLVAALGAPRPRRWEWLREADAATGDAYPQVEGTEFVFGKATCASATSFGPRPREDAVGGARWRPLWCLRPSMHAPSRARARGWGREVLLTGHSYSGGR